MESKIICKTIQINAPASVVWDTLTNPELIKLWLSDTDIHVTSDWKMGSPMRFTGTWHKMKFEDKGNILVFEKEKVFKYNYWSRISRLPDSIENYTIIEFSLTNKENETILTLIQTNFITEATYSHWNFYWLVTLDVMKKLIEQKHVHI